MSYFSDHYGDIRFPIAEDIHPGLRNAQSGAIHAVASHFTLREDPAVVVMPTGSGKTIVLAMAAFLLRSKRVLVLTPSRLVRGQVVEEFATLRKLKEIGALPDDCPSPVVREVTELLASEQSWQDLLGCDVVIGTPSSVSPAVDGVSQPPPDMFDVVMVDEAHHSPAKTWNAAMEAFPHAKRVLFTATPFRRDAKEIKGKFAYLYPVLDAYEDGIFGDVAYIPVLPEVGQDADVAIARASERTFNEDRAAGLDHVLMVRTDSKSRANLLADVYGQHTALRLRVIHSGHSLVHIKSVLSKLRSRELDGVIAVDMLGEGFDFPQLKIAAVHAPHKSLAVTLQFIGRFARTNAGNLGAAKFLAVPTDIELEAQRLYTEQAVWGRIVPNLLTSKIERETQIRDALASFETVDEQATELDLEDLSLYGLTPYHHVKIFRCRGAVDLFRPIGTRTPEVVHREVSDDLNALVVVLKTTERPDWTHLDALAKVTYDLALVYFHEKTGFLFICSSLRDEGLYAVIADSLVDEANYSSLPPSVTYGALNGLSDLVFFNVGMRKRAFAADAESYRISTGPSANRSISKSDGNLYSRGHVYGRGWDGERNRTIGISSASKLWSNRRARLPELVAWCEEQALRMSAAAGATGCELDFLQTGVEAEAIPEGVLAAVWARQTFNRAPFVHFRDEFDHLREIQLLDCELQLDRNASTEDVVSLALVGEGLRVPLQFRVEGQRHFELAAGADESVAVGGHSTARPLVQFLNSEMPTFYFADGSSLEGRILTPPPGEGFLMFDSAKISPIDWPAAGIDPTTEKRSVRTDGLRSVHEFVEEQLEATNAKVILFDDDTGELADYVAISFSDDEMFLDLYHCKGAGGLGGGDRVNDVYEVVGQAMKSIFVAMDSKRLSEHVERRVTRPHPSRFVRGSIEDFNELLDAARHRSRHVRMIVVQPGVSQAGLSEKLAGLLSMGDDALLRAGCRFEVWGSA